MSMVRKLEIVSMEAKSGTDRLTKIVAVILDGKRIDLAMDAPVHIDIDSEAGNVLHTVTVPIPVTGTIEWVEE